MPADFHAITHKHESWARGLLALTLAGLAGAAQSAPWTTIGSAGALDDADMGEIDFSDGIAAISNAAPDTTVSYLRYNIPSMAGFKGSKTMQWRARFRDTGADAQVRLFLRKYRFDGVSENLTTFDSNAFPSSSLYQQQSQCILVDWDFTSGAYYIQAQLTRSAAGGSAGLGLIQLVPASCTPASR